MGRSAEKWARKVEPHFGFLRDAGFSRVEADDSSFWSLWVQYASPTAAVRISKSNEFIRAEVQLIRLVDGHVPPYPIWITSERIDWTLLDNVLEARYPGLQAESRRLTGLDESALERQLTFWADALRVAASDFLGGSFDAIDEAAVLVRQRVADHPQEIVEWIPEEAPQTAEVEAHADLVRTVPPEVGIRTRRYRRKKP
jgi:hypothetical protein